MKTYGRHQSLLVKKARLNKKLSQKDLDLSMGMGRSTKGQFTSNFERGRSGIPPKHIMKICRLLEIPVIDMVNAMAMDFKENLLKLVQDGNL